MPIILILAALSCDPTGLFVRGDVNNDGQVNISDVNRLFDYLFLGDLPPCEPDSADVNDDGVVNITDGSVLLHYLFNGGDPPPSPFPDSGFDCTPGRGDCRLSPVKDLDRSVKLIGHHSSRTRSIGPRPWDFVSITPSSDKKYITARLRNRESCITPDIGSDIITTWTVADNHYASYRALKIGVLSLNVTFSVKVLDYDPQPGSTKEDICACDSTLCNQIHIDTSSGYIVYEFKTLDDKNTIFIDQKIKNGSVKYEWKTVDDGLGIGGETGLWTVEKCTSPKDIVVRSCFVPDDLTQPLPIDIHKCDLLKMTRFQIIIPVYFRSHGKDLVKVPTERIEFTVTPDKLTYIFPKCEEFTESCDE